MYIVLPIGHEDQRVQRWPVVTIGLIVLNLALLIYSQAAMKQQARVIRQRWQEFARYYMENVELDLPQKLKDMLPKDKLNQIDFSRSLGGTLRSTPEELETSQKHLNQLFDRVLEATQASVFYRYGYIPDKGGVLQMVTYAFLHGGFWHFFGNMLILWLVAPNIEDTMGRILFPLFYLVSAVFAAMGHAIFHSASQVPLIGASGAVAAMMGAFLIKMTRTRIRFFYVVFFFFFKAGTFSLPAYIVLPIWLGIQVLQGLISISVKIVSVAFWAHVAGFLFGLFMSLILKHSKVEEKYIEKSLEKKVGLFKQEYLRALELIDTGQSTQALPVLQRLMKEQRGDPIVGAELAKIYLARGDTAKAQMYANTAYAAFLSRDMPDSVVELYENMLAADAAFLPAARICLEIAGLLRRRQRYEEAMSLCRQAFNLYRQTPLSVELVITYSDILLKDQADVEQAARFLSRARRFFNGRPRRLQKLEAYIQENLGSL